MLFRTLVQSPSACWIGGESHQLIEGIPVFHPSQRGWDSNRLLAADATPDKVAELRGRFLQMLRNRDGAPAQAELSMIEKTPKNSLRVPFLAKAFPKARFLFLRRDARQTLSSMIEAWQSGNFRTYPRLPDWSGLPWSLLLTPGWQELRGRPLEEIVAHRSALLARYQNAAYAARYRQLVANEEKLARLGDSIDQRVAEELLQVADRRLAVEMTHGGRWDLHLREIAEAMLSRVGKGDHIR